MTDFIGVPLEGVAGYVPADLDTSGHGHGPGVDWQCQQCLADDRERLAVLLAEADARTP